MSRYWKNKKVLVTGAGGFIGSHLVERLAAGGAAVRAFVRYNSRGDAGLLSMLPEALADTLTIVPGDLRDLPAMIDAMRGVETVFHLGALIAIPYSYRHPAEVVDVNVMGTLNVLLAARETSPRTVVHTSTSEVYGTALRAPIDETHPLQGQSPYSASKIGADKLAESFFRAFDLPVTTVRPFNTYGPRQSDRAVIPTIISQALVQDVIRLGNLEATRDLTYVSDTVAGFLAAAEAEEDAVGGTYNLGTGREISIGDLAAEIIRLIGRDVRIEIDPDRLRPEKSEVERLLSDNSLAARELGWSPQVTLEEGLERTIAWVAGHGDYYTPDAYTT